MIGERKPNLKLSDIETILQGHDPQEGIRFIDVNYYSTKANLFIRKKDDAVCSVMTEPYRPFVWFKGFDFEENWQWRYVSFPISQYDPTLGVVQIRDEVLTLSDTFQKIGKSPNGKEVFFKIFLTDIQDRKKLCWEKMQEYNIQIDEQITSYGKNKVERMERGFKFLVHINPPEEDKYYTNPALAYNDKTGKLKKITGTYANLIDFFHEGGLDLWKRSGVFLDKWKFLEFWKNSDNNQKLFFFLSIPFKELFFNITSDVIDDLSEEESDSALTVVDKPELLNFISTNFNETVKSKDIFEFLTAKLHEIGYQFIINHPELNKIIKPKLNHDLLDHIVENDYTFENRKGFKQLNQFLLTHYNCIDIFRGEDRLFYCFSPLEQYMMQSGKRLFKGFEDYSDLRVMTMDIETKAQEGISDKDAALFAHKGRIFKIGIMCTSGTGADGYENVLNCNNDAEELTAIYEFFKILSDIDPDLVITYNGEGFDWPFILKRVEILEKLLVEEQALDKIREKFVSYYEKFGVYIGKHNYFKRTKGTLKVGGSSENYLQTSQIGRNFCDTMFAVKRAAAINKSIPNFKLKDNIKHAKLAKSNRVYVPGDQIGNIENSPSKFYLNESTGDWIRYHKEIIFLKEKYNESLIKKKGTNTFIYEDEKTLYLWDLELDGEFMDSCQNAMLFDPNHIEEFFDMVYEKFQSYDKIAFQTKYVGSWLDGEKRDLLKFKLKELRENLSNKNKFYPDKDFSEYTEVDGKEIIKRYLIDDLWETIKLDEHYSQATFLISQWLPTSYQRAATIGGASIWKLFLTSYSYNYGLAIPEYEEPRDFSGGLVAMFSSGYHGPSFKADFGGLYPAANYEHVDTPDFDILGAIKLFTYYGVSKRNKFKDLMNQAKERLEDILSKKLDAKQMPLKIINNSFYGMLGAFAVTPFANLLSAWGVTCVGRQFFRLMIRWFEERGFCATIGHTDGLFFSFGTADLKYKYVGLGKNWKVEKGKTYEGIAAYVAEFNDLFMTGIMCLDIDEIVLSVLNFSKGNYLYMKDKKKKDGTVEKVVEVIGGAVIKKNQSEYISKFFDTNILLLMDNKPLEFLNAYWDYIKQIYENKIPSKEIATRAKNKKSKSEYLDHIKGKNKNGQALNRQAHMELLIRNNIDFEVGDMTYYLNTGKSKRDPDSKSVNSSVGSFDLESIDLKSVESIFEGKRPDIKKFILTEVENGNFIPNKNMDGDIYSTLDTIEEWKTVKIKVKSLKKGLFAEVIKTEYILNCDLVDLDSNQITPYNTELYIHKFNSAIHPLFVCFDPQLRDKIIIDNPINKPMILERDLKLINGVPFEKDINNQITTAKALELSPEEIEFWSLAGRSSDTFMEKRL